MTQSPQSMSDELTIKEIAKEVVDLIDRVAKIENNGTSGLAVEEQLRAYRLLKMENASAQNFAAGFFNRAEPLMDKLSAAEMTVAQKVDEATTQAMAVIESGKSAANGAKNLTVKVAQDAQQTLEELKVTIQELQTAQADLKTMQNTVMTRWNEQTQEIKTANIERYAEEAAAAQFANLTDEKLKEMIDQRIRIALG